MKKLLPILAIAALPCTAHAQNFSFLFDTSSAYTSGYDEDFIAIENTLQNTSTESFTFDWRMLNPEVELPAGWGYNGFCDNITCYTPASTPNPFSGATLTSLPVAGRESSPFKLQMDIPVSAADGLVVFEFEAKTTEHTDTAYFLVQKTPLGISTANLTDNQLNIYPNPATAQVHIQVEGDAAVHEVILMDIVGRQIADIKIQGSSTSFDVSKLAPGQYIFQAVDEVGTIVGLRRFVKQ